MAIELTNSTNSVKVTHYVKSYPRVTENKIKKLLNDNDLSYKTITISTHSPNERFGSDWIKLDKDVWTLERALNRFSTLHYKTATFGGASQIYIKKEINYRGINVYHTPENCRDYLRIDTESNYSEIHRLSGNMEFGRDKFVEYYICNLNKKQIEKLYTEAIQIDYSRDYYVERQLLQDAYSK